jgi:N6-L-threonylcarbamoyladenine synthase
MEPNILAIDTSCDETSAAITCGRRILANIVSSQIDIHKKYGGVFPALAKRAHQERIDPVIAEALKRARIKPGELGAIAVTPGPGLAIALEVGIRKAKELAQNYSLPLIAVNHMEGHIYSALAQNRNGRPKREAEFPALCLLVSGGHTELVLMTAHGQYEILGETLDDAAGEALDKAARILKLGYPGGPIIETLAEQISGAPAAKLIKNDSKFRLNPALVHKKDLNFSYSGLKTQFLYLTQKLSPQELGDNLTTLAAAFQEAVFEQLIRKTSQAIEMYQPKTLICGGGVSANKYLRLLLRRLAKETKIPLYFPTSKRLTGDNAAMIGVAAAYKYQRKKFVEKIEALDRVPRLSL